MKLRMIATHRALLLLLSALLWVTNCPAQEARGEADSIPPPVEQQKEIAGKALDAICIEIVREYVTQRGGKFPDNVAAAAGLDKYLQGMYRNENHELRQVVANLRQYKDKFGESDTAIEDYLRNGVKQYAVDANAQPLKINDEKVEQIISQAQQSIKGLTRTRRAETPTVPGKLQPTGPTGPGALTAFAQRNALTLVGVLTLTNLCLLALVIYQWRRNKPRPLTAPAALLEEHHAEQTVEPLESATGGSPAVDGHGEAPTIEAGGEPPASVAEEIQRPTVSSNGRRKNKWLVVGASVAGKMHVASNPPIPCQDSNSYRDLGGGWGIAVVCDGAGSKEYSHYGARFVAKQAAHYFEEIVKQNDWQKTNSLPTQEQWQELSKRAFARIRKELEEYAREKHEVDSTLLSCTVIVVVHSPVGILASHIGDGRAAFCNTDNEWKAMISPYKGEEANQTIFITSVEWDRPDKYIESTVFHEQPLAFALMSDGCESHSFEVNVFDEQERKYKDLNRPYPKFFQPLVTTLKTLYQNQAAPEEINAKWQAFIEGGSEKLKNEPDDKTMILGVLVN